MIDFNEYKNDIFNPLIYDLQESDKRFVINYGGAGSGKSYTQTQHEIMNCLERKHTMLVIRKYATTLKDSCIALFKSILSDWDLIDSYEENKSDRTITFFNGSVILFKGMDDPEKIKSVAGVTRVWIEEASELSIDDFKQLNLRLRGRNDLQMTLTFNPIDVDHWIKKHFFDTPDISKRTTIIKTTYKDNRFIDDAYKLELESYKLFDQVYYDVYCLGDWGVITEGRIFPIWDKQDKFPADVDYWYGLDFGFSNDPCAIVKTFRQDNTIYLEEVAYHKGMTNEDIYNFMIGAGYDNEMVVCDSAEPKSITELNLFGLQAYGADKGKGSIMAGISNLKQCMVVICGNSPNIEKENKFYQWEKKKDGTFIAKPKDFMNHIIDATRYAYSIGVSNDIGFFVE